MINAILQVALAEQTRATENEHNEEKEWKKEKNNKKCRFLICQWILYLSFICLVIGVYLITVEINN